MEHIENLDAVLFNFELAGVAVNAVKTQWCRKQIEVVGYICGAEGRLPPKRKVIKIREWTAYRDVGEVRSFLSLAGCFRV